MRATSPDNARCQHLEILIHHLEEAQQSTTNTLQPLLKHGEITFDLLWALFRPNQLVFTECSGTGKPRCIKYDFGDFVTELGEKKFRIEGRYYDYDGKQFGEASIKLNIAGYQGTKRIESLGAFPLEYHPQQQIIRTQLAQCGQSFVQLTGTHHRHYHGRAFTVVKGEKVKVEVNGRIIVDPLFFREMNPNYFKPQIDPCLELFFAGVSLDELAAEELHDALEESKPATLLSEEDFLRCNATVVGFSFSEKMWCKSPSNIRCGGTKS